MQDGLSKIPGVECREPEGGRSTCFPCGRLVGKIVAGVAIRTPTTSPASAWKAHVAPHARSSFGLDGYIRISYAASEETLREALTRLAKLFR